MEKKTIIILNEYGTPEILDASLFNIYSSDIPKGSVLITGYDIETEVF